MKAIFRRGHNDHGTKAQKHASAAPSHSGAHITHPSHASSPAIAAVTLSTSGGAPATSSSSTTTTSTSTTSTSTTASPSSSPSPLRLRDPSREPLGGAYFLNYKPSAPVFGVPLTEVVEREGRDLPAIAELSMAYLDRYGLKLEGIFRIPGNTINVDNLKLYFDGAGDYSLEVCDDVHAVAGLLKLYLRELPEPLLTHRFYDTFIAVQKNPDVNYRMTNLRKLVCALPPAHKRLLTALLGFLLRVADNVAVNKMTLPNLAIVFGPNILRPRHESMLRMIEDARFVNGVLKTLLEEYEFLVTNTTSRPKLGGSQVAAVEEPKEEDTVISSSIMNYTGPAGGRRKARMGAIKFDPSQIEELGGEQGELPAKSVKEFLQVTHGRTRIASVHLDVPPVIEVNGELKPIDSPTRLPQLQSSQPQQRLASPSAPASLGAEVGFDLSRPLEYCNQVLSQLRAAQNRPEDLAAMTPAQLKEEKVLVKRLLRQFDATFKEKHGKLPSKPQKEPLRPLYMRYRELTKLVGDPADDDNLSGTTTTTTTDQPARSDSPKPTPVPAPASPKVLSTSGDGGGAPPASPILESKEYKAMKREKRKLQLQLHQYQNEFIARHGRKVQYLEDRLPVQNEYERYKELKASLAAMEQQAQQGR